MKRILVLNGPNLDRLGTRQVDVYGSMTLQQIEESLRAQASTLGVEVVFVQSADEQTLVDAVAGGEPGRIDGIVINPAAFSHFSHRLVDALQAAGVPVVEVHLSNIHAREPYRRLSLVSPIARGVICGLGPDGYRFALEACARMLSPS